MARTAVDTQPITRGGLTPGLTEPNVDGDAIATGAVALVVDNTSGSSVTVTVLATARQDGLALEDLTVSVPAGDMILIGPFPRRTFGRPAGDQESGDDDRGRAYVDWSAQTGVNRAVIGL